jgi:hypothetical protein
VALKAERPRPPGLRQIRARGREVLAGCGSAGARPDPGSPPNVPAYPDRACGECGRCSRTRARDPPFEEEPADLPSWFRSNVEPIPERLVDRVYEWFERPSSEDRFRLRRPAGRNLGDGFYREVARAYTAAVAAGLNPRKALAEDAATPADTVARWTAEARRRGYLPPAKPGRVTPMAQVQDAVREAAREMDDG